jgi:hypothetical protein
MWIAAHVPRSSTCVARSEDSAKILQLPHVGIGTASTRLLLERMLAKVEGLCDEHERPQESAGRSNQRDAGWRPLRSFILRVHRHHAAHPQLVFLGSNLITSVPSAFPLLRRLAKINAYSFRATFRDQSLRRRFAVPSRGCSSTGCPFAYGTTLDRTSVGDRLWGSLCSLVISRWVARSTKA